MEIEHKRMAGPMMLGNSAIRSTDRLAGKRLTQAEIEQALGRKYTPPAPRDFDMARAEFTRLYGSQATVAPARDVFSVFEITP